MKKGDRIIWNSGFGFDLGYFLSEEGSTMGTNLVRLVTGRLLGNKDSIDCSFPTSQIISYSDEINKILSLNYRTRKKEFNKFNEMIELPLNQPS